MEKIKYRAKTIDDYFIVEGLCGIAQLEKESKSKESWFLVGGIAVQSYLPSSCRRPTSDIDLALLVPLNYESFKEYSKPVKEYLQDKGFQVEEKKGHNTFILKYKKDEETGVIEFARRNKQNLKRIIKRLEEEMKNTRLKVIEGKREFYRVSSPEDIISPKMVRSIMILKEFPELKEEYLTKKIYPLTEKKIEESLNEIEKIKEEARLSEGNLEIACRLRFVSDIYDIKVLSELTGFNEDYLKESLYRWSKNREDSEEKNILMKSLLPFIKI
ncbi:MAG: hypothetical protein QW273_00200 [Candidatus Pacearchaeota archaeon]